IATRLGLYPSGWSSADAARPAAIVATQASGVSETSLWLELSGPENTMKQSEIVLRRRTRQPKSVGSEVSVQIFLQAPSTEIKPRIARRVRRDLHSTGATTPSVSIEDAPKLISDAVGSAIESQTPSFVL